MLSIFVCQLCWCGLPRSLPLGGGVRDLGSNPLTFFPAGLGEVGLATLTGLFERRTREARYTCGRERWRERCSSGSEGLDGRHEGPTGVYVLGARGP